MKSARVKNTGQPFFSGAAAPRAPEKTRRPERSSPATGSFRQALFRPGTLLAVLLTFAFVFQLCNIAAFRPAAAQGSGAQKTAANMDAASEATDEQPPPLTQDDLNKAVKEAARKPDDGSAPAPAAPGNGAAVMGKSGSADTSKSTDTAADNSTPPPPAGATTSFSPSEVEVLQSLAKRRDDLDRREKRVAEQEALLSAAEQEVDHKIAELNKLKGEIENLLGQQQKMETDRLQSLVKIYEGMKPKEAAAIFNTLDMEVLLPVISRMNERKSGPILAAMNPDKARVVTIRLAQQRDLPAAAPPAKKPEPGPPPLPPPP